MAYYEKEVLDIIAGKNKMIAQKRTEIEQARNILKSLGRKVAIRYLQKRFWSIESVLWILFKLEIREVAT